MCNNRCFPSQSIRTINNHPYINNYSSRRTNTLIAPSVVTSIAYGPDNSLAIGTNWAGTYILSPNVINNILNFQRHFDNDPNELTTPERIQMDEFWEDYTTYIAPPERERHIVSALTYCGGALYIAYSNDHALQVWNGIQVVEMPFRALKSLSCSPAITPTGGTLDGSIVTFEEGNVNAIRVQERAVPSLAYGPNGILAIGSLDGKITFINQNIPGIVGEVDTQTNDSVNTLAVSPDGMLTAGLDNGEILTLDFITRNIINRIQTGHTINSIAYKNVEEFAAGTQSGNVLIYKRRPNNRFALEKTLLTSDERAVSSVAYSPTGVLTAGTGDAIQLWYPR